jgi:anti-sigma regulatory factor (Ser/Thr protein kinase)
VTALPEDPVRRDDDTVARATLVLERDVHAPAAARDWLTAAFGDSVTSGEIQDACLVLSELVTNALRYGLGDIVVHAALVDDCVQLSVTDWADEMPRVLAADPERVGGVGLLVVERVSAAWGVAPFPGGKTVWASITASGRAKGRARALR